MKPLKPLIFLSLIVFLWSLMYANTYAQNTWDNRTYPHEIGFQNRIKPMLKRIASKGFGKKSLANSKCPDTGLLVKTWALKGDSIISPYTGRKYVQGETGYFGPKARNEKGEIIAFGGDPLKKDLPPATATLLLNPDDPKAKAFLSIPGNLRQQYHFACKNWIRFYPLLADTMGEAWKEKFYYWVSNYSEKRRPSDGNREMLDLSRAHNLVGEKGQLLGGNTFDGGTENHKTMWRTSALLYSQLFPESAKISGYSLEEAEKLTKEMLLNFAQRLLHTGNGEYDSEVYYPHSIEAFLNLYDFSPDPDTKALAKFILDYYFATYGLKVIDGAEAGAMKRGYLPSTNADEMEEMQWAFFDHTSRPMNEAIITIQQATTSYRPNKIICNITQKNLPLPFEAKMSRPFYHMDYPHAFAETFYCSEHFALGNVQMTLVDNPNQQMIWSVMAQGTQGALAFSGGHPMRESTSGHSPYTQTLHAKGTLILMTAPTQYQEVKEPIGPQHTKLRRANLWHLPKEDQPKNFELANRQKYGQKPLHNIEKPDNMSADKLDIFWKKSLNSASSWFFFPKELKPQWMDGAYFIEANQTYLAIIPLSQDHFILNPSDEITKQLTNKKAKSFFQRYALIDFLGQTSGYIVEVVEKKDYTSLHDFAQALKKKTKLDDSQLEKQRLTYKSLYGDALEMQYQAKLLRCKAKINGKIQDWDNHTQGAVYTSPYIQVKDGIMKISDGKDSYQINFKGEKPVWREEK